MLGRNANEEKRGSGRVAHTAPRLGDTRPFLCKRKWTWVARVTAAGARPSNGRYDHVHVTDSFPRPAHLLPPVLTSFVRLLASLRKGNLRIPEISVAPTTAPNATLKPGVCLRNVR